ncbi:transcriptional regulator of sulfur amino acid metabolism [Ophidiomyces ophidiicola]|uniref:transcriptional regulator of sulfur amino acid metabolism n=1 Tax=Ophidiomyces ophidiicola TaxID=1387563 RepID=UPI0020C22C6B|nr:transcriptional regulator of sulfur amino acid metabolism [Ophidiomyces ophidiicola]KAI1919216.1 transcriptional regulator of sulfur amino acid metabolism [Ophidiomyces ophidiicola]KAI1939707.1 transcriptional regulator of sulfur amino acid metabolism [Ophidiomyces ophidiicola]KAI1954197.1 transcriptional regulator of sulfur amino acid metabolism [Ophidiomyces ophidiicola]KAI1960025.1 transcriptional regulator of sulfur amino acid metabolism [Ophidiomyces ophidiicola]KAI1971098.1 transcript
MGAAFDALNMQQSLGSRRPAPTTLPSFELPSPHAPQPQQKHQLHPTVNTTQPSIAGVKVGNLLTPPSNSAADSSSASAGLAGPGQIQAYSQSYWPAPSYGFNSGRTTAHSSISDNLSPSYPQNTMYPSPLSPSPALSVSSTQQHDQQQPQNQRGNYATGQPQPASQANTLDPFGQKYTYNGSQQPPASPTSFNPYQSGVQPPSSSAPSGRVPGMPIQYPLDTQQPLPQFTRPYPSYSLPAMNGPIMSNIHNPNNQMALIGSVQPNLLPGFNSGHAASLHQMYPHAHTHHLHGLVQAPQNDRPFRCDLCPQSFNRNHDLKRHKRIHLAVKPFPCHHCDKSFSRKDALKRHILVKGCGKESAADGNTSSSSTNVKDETTGTVSPPHGIGARHDKYS